MNAFVQHLTNGTTTDNGCRANRSTLNSCVDLFFSGAASRNTDDTRDLIKLALKEDKVSAIKICFYLRDVRDGQGKRDILRALVDVLVETNQQDLLAHLMPYFPEIGRWKDIFEHATKYNQVTLKAMRNTIESVKPENFSLMCKWMPRKGKEAEIIAKVLELQPKVYRRFIVDGTNVVESLMCAKKWDEIDFSKLPSAAAKLYQNAFKRNCADSYELYISKLEKGEAKVNSSTLYPHDITTLIRSGQGSTEVLNAQWNALPDYMQNSEKFNVFPIIDTSSSMYTVAYGNISCMDISIGIGLYVAERNRGAFKDVWCNFSTSPSIFKLKGDTVSKRINNLDYNTWSGSTNLQAVFNLVLKTAVENRVSKDDMPKVILIVSDMQFDRCSENRTGFGMIDNKYKDAGYERPLIVFWNVNSNSKNTPVTINDDKTIAIGGYSTSILKDILKGNFENINPLNFMYEAIESRYLYLDNL